MRKLCFVLTLALGGAILLPPDEAQARARSHHGAKHHYILKKKHARNVKHRTARSVSKHRTGRLVSLSGVTPVLAAKAREIVADCGSVVISTISARGNRSNHPAGRAVDLRGNPRCIYAHLKGWPGGYSTDYSAVAHVHVSYNPGGQEWGLRFAHNSHGRHRATRFARRSLPRDVIEPSQYASAVHATH
jgi:hypothetical protein